MEPPSIVDLPTDSIPPNEDDRTMTSERGVFTLQTYSDPRLVMLETKAPRPAKIDDAPRKTVDSTVTCFPVAAP